MTYASAGGVVGGLTTAGVPLGVELAGLGGDAPVVAVTVVAGAGVVALGRRTEETLPLEERNKVWTVSTYVADRTAKMAA